MIAKGYKSFEVKMNKLQIIKEGDSYGVIVSFRKSKEIDKLHRLIIKKLNPLREGHIREIYKDPDYIKRFSKGKRSLIKKILFEVGYPRALDAYDPHISITRFGSPIWRKDIELPRFNFRRMWIKEIGIFTMGEYGTCRKLIHKFTLK